MAVPLNSEQKKRLLVNFMEEHGDLHPDRDHLWSELAEHINHYSDRGRPPMSIAGLKKKWSRIKNTAKQKANRLKYVLPPAPPPPSLTQLDKRVLAVIGRVKMEKTAPGSETVAPGTSRPGAEACALEPQGLRAVEELLEVMMKEKEKDEEREVVDVPVVVEEAEVIEVSDMDEEPEVVQEPQTVEEPQLTTETTTLVAETGAVRPDIRRQTSTRAPRGVSGARWRRGVWLPRLRAELIRAEAVRQRREKEQEAARERREKEQEVVRERREKEQEAARERREKEQEVVRERREKEQSAMLKELQRVCDKTHALLKTLAHRSEGNGRRSPSPPAARARESNEREQRFLHPYVRHRNDNVTTTYRQGRTDNDRHSRDTRMTPE